MTIAEKIASGKTYLGIEFGSTRIKAVLTDDTYAPVASGSHEWENRFENGVWTYSLDDITTGLQSCFADLVKDVKAQYDTELTTAGAMGISAMMHGIMAFDKDDNLLTPFRTWRNTITGQAADELSELLSFNIPQRWSISHLYQCILNGDEFVGKIDRVMTLAVYIHYLLTGKFEAGIGEASGMFPIGTDTYDKAMAEKMNKLLESKGFAKKLEEVFPAVAMAGDKGAVLTEAGAKFLDPTGKFGAGVPVCPPEGDAGTGMTATNSVRVGTGNVSAGTSIFSMLVMDKPLKNAYKEIDVVTTPHGAQVAMVHCNNCCAELDAWVKMFEEYSALMGIQVSRSDIYEKLYTNAMKADPSCGGVTAYNFLSGEPVAGIDEGHPMYFRNAGEAAGIGEFMRAQLYSSMAALKMGMDILFDKENASADMFNGHGGLFKVKGAAQQILADGLNTPVAVMKTAGEGGAWGMALLAAYMMNGNGKSLPDWLDSDVFAGMEKTVCQPDAAGKAGFDTYIARFRNGLAAQKALYNN